MGKLVWDPGEIAMSNPFLKPLKNYLGQYITSLDYFFRIVPLKAWLGVGDLPYHRHRELATLRISLIRRVGHSPCQQYQETIFENVYLREFKVKIAKA